MEDPGMYSCLLRFNWIRAVSINYWITFFLSTNHSNLNHNHHDMDSTLSSQRNSHSDPPPYPVAARPPAGHDREILDAVSILHTSVLQHVELRRVTLAHRHDLPLLQSHVAAD